LQTWDVFSPAGQYLPSAPIPLGHEMRDGTCYLLGGERMVVVRGTASSFHGEQTVEENEEELEPEPLEVICYRFGQGSAQP
jgi:hypothetical protein